jgi:hypothetical protein
MHDSMRPTERGFSLSRTNSVIVCGLVLLLVAGCAGEGSAVPDTIAADGGLSYVDGRTDGPVVDGPPAPADGQPPKDGSGGPDTATPDGPGADGSPLPKPIERTLSYTGTGSAKWLHVIYRDAVGVITVRTARINENLAPPFVNKLSTSIPDGQCTTVTITGTFVSDGTPFTTTVTSCRAGDDITISHSSQSGSNPPGPSQVHGTVSMDPADTSLPYERSLVYVGTSGAEWLHVALLPVGGTLVDVRTLSYNGALTPSVRDYQVDNLAVSACKTHTFSGTVNSNSAPFSTEVKYCRSASAVTVEHVSTISGSTGTPQAHGGMPIP